MTNRESLERGATPSRITVHPVDERIRGLVGDLLQQGVSVTEDVQRLSAATVAEHAWKVTAGTPEERDELASHLAAALNQHSIADQEFRVCFVDQWSTNEAGQWWGELYFAVGGADQAETELQRCMARDTANTFLEEEGSPYRLG